MEVYVCEKVKGIFPVKMFFSFIYYDANDLFICVHKDYVGQGDQGQTNRCRSFARGTCLENIKKTR